MPCGRMSFPRSMQRVVWFFRCQLVICVGIGCICKRIRNVV